MRKILAMYLAATLGAVALSQVGSQTSAVESKDDGRRREAESTARFDGFLSKYATDVEAIAFFRQQYLGCVEYGRVDLEKDRILVLRWPVGSLVGAHQYVFLEQFARVGSWHVILATASTVGEYRIVKKRRSIEMSNDRGVVVSLGLNAEGRVMLLE